MTQLYATHTDLEERRPCKPCVSSDADVFVCPLLLIAAFFSLYVAGLLLDHALALKGRKSQGKKNASPNTA